MMDKINPRTMCNAPGDEIVISGISGQFPNSVNIKELEHNLYNKIDMIDEDERRWRHEFSELSRRGARIRNLEKFDATFFGVHYKQANLMDPQARILLEIAYEAILDAGMNPKTLRGTKTGVFIASCNNESDKTEIFEKLSEGGLSLTGCSRALFANRISHAFGLQGPSLVIDTACSSSLYALDVAYTAMRNGECDAALIGGANLTLHPYVSLQFARLGVLAHDGMCRPFDDKASGYVRAEAISVLLLQKFRDANRVYGTVVHSKTNCDGYKDEGITYPSGYMQAKLLSEFYKEINIKPETVDYIEAHSTGTVVGDPEECYAIDEVFCKNRNTPMPVGSVKSNLGHAEAAAGLCSIAKCILAMESQLIPPNMHYSIARKGIKSLEENRLQVVANTQKLDGPLIAINSFGFGGTNAHCLLRSHSKVKINKGAPNDSIPRLVNWSGRTEDACHIVLEDLASQPLDIEYVALLHNTQRESISGNVFRSYGVYRHVEDNNAQCIMKEIQHFSGIKRPIVYVFSGMGSQWSGMGAGLLEVPIFYQAIQKCHALLKPRGLDLLNIITAPDKNMFDNIVHSFVGIAAIQAALCDCLEALNIQPDYMIGHSVGELGCAYADSSLTMEQMILCAYFRGVTSLETKTTKGAMAAIGLSYKDIKNRLPPTIDVACHNGSDSCTISGPKQEIENYVAKLVTDGIFAKEVPCSNIAYHSRYISEMGPILLDLLREVIPVPKKRSSKWLSTSVPEHKWSLPESQYCSAQYQTNNLLSSVLFHETSLLLPTNAIFIEIAPHGLLQAILKRSLTSAVYIPLTQRDNKQNLDYFFTALGKIYLNGIDTSIENLYPNVELPVSRGTRRISHLIKWDHSVDWHVMKFNTQKTESGEKRFNISLQDVEYEYISGHVIDGRCLFPATGYLSLVWKTFADMEGTIYSEISVQFEDVKYLRATMIPIQDRIEFIVMIQFGTGRFEITEGGAAVVTGYIYKLPSDTKLTNLPQFIKNEHIYLPTKDFYKELRLRGYNYKGLFRNVIEARSDGLHGKVRWNKNWVSFMDCLLQILIIGKDTRGLLLPTGIDYLIIDIRKHQEFINQFDPENTETQLMEMFMNKNTKICQAGGVEMKGLQANPIGRRKALSLPVLESYKFVPYLPTPTLSAKNSGRICIQHALENHQILRVKCVEILNNEAVPFITNLKEAIEDLPLVTGDLTILTSEEILCENIHVENSKLSSQTNCLFVIASNFLTRLEFLEYSKASLIEHGYILSREPANLDPNQIFIPQGFYIISVMPLESETLVLLQNKSKIQKDPIPIKISIEDKEFKWLEQLKADIKRGDIVIYSENEALSGIIGLVNCIRREPNGSNVTCVFILDPKAPPFDTKNPFYQNQLKLNFAINVYRNGQWGTYRHLALDKLIRKGPTSTHIQANLAQRGDLSTFRWLNGRFTRQFAVNQTKIQFAALNFKDVMLATGKLAVEIFGRNRLDQECVLGFEYSGIDYNGNKIMGIALTGAISSHIVSDPGLTWACPKQWSLEQAATVPVVYYTVYTALFYHARIEKGKSILIHAGTGGVGLAAIRVSLAYGLNVFTTVSSKEKREYLLNTFSELKDSHIGNSRDLTFENMIHIQTNGAGVDYVLNSLAGKKLLASLRCLGEGGKFVEIGKFDMANDNKIGLRDFLKEISFQATLTENLYKAPLEQKMKINAILQKDIDAGIIKPLPTTIFPASEIEAAFRYLASAKHIGKVLLKIREDPYDDVSMPVTIYPRFYCEANSSYVVVGGLGGFGLELIDWLIMRGARKILISSSKGISKPYQAYRIKVWETYSAIIKINISDIGTRDGCEKVLKEATNLGPVAGIFNLAVVLQDGILENQTVEKFNRCFIPKVNATIFLDQLSRKLCPTLSNFVVFSSVSCGRGNAGQMNYGMANSVMERVIEQRRNFNLPGKAIQWGVVGEVGLVADMQEDKLDMEIAGTLQQRIASCLQELDNLLMGDSPIVGSMVVAEKRVSSIGDDIISNIMNVMGIQDKKSISMDSTLAELGMDSLMAVEIKQCLETNFDIILSGQDLRTITFAKLYALNETRKQSGVEEANLISPKESITGIQMLFQSLGKQMSYSKSVIRLPSQNNTTNFKTVSIIIPGIVGVESMQWNNLASSSSLPVFFTQMTNLWHTKTLKEIVEAISTEVHEGIAKHVEQFCIVGYSFGSAIALHLANELEETGIQGNVVLIDGSIPFLQKILRLHPIVTENTIEIALCIYIINQIFSNENLVDLQEKFTKIPTWEERVNKLLEYGSSQKMYTIEYLRGMIEGLYNRLKMILHAKNSDIPKIKSPITLIRPTDVSILDIDEDYELGKYTEHKVVVKYIDGNHSTILDNPKLIELLNELQNLNNNKI